MNINNSIQKTMQSTQMDYEISSPPLHPYNIHYIQALLHSFCCTLLKPEWKLLVVWLGWSLTLLLLYPVLVLVPHAPGHTPALDSGPLPHCCWWHRAVLHWSLVTPCACCVPVCCWWCCSVQWGCCWLTRGCCPRTRQPATAAPARAASTITTPLHPPQHSSKKPAQIFSGAKFSLDFPSSWY